MIYVQTISFEIFLSKTFIMHVNFFSQLIEKLIDMQFGWKSDDYYNSSLTKDKSLKLDANNHKELTNCWWWPPWLLEMKTVVCALNSHYDWLVQEWINFMVDPCSIKKQRCLFWITFKKRINKMEKNKLL